MAQIKDFLNEDYITFAGYDNSRKISSVVDGLKISQRKVLYTILKNNIDSETKEVKVEQLSAKTSEQTSYLHGATSLNGVAVGMAANYVGSNNINLFEPDGNFGTRFIKDASAPRYIYTYLSEVSKYLLKKEDEPVLTQQTFEGQVIEPKTYYPILPLVLVNGAEGLSVGFSSKIYSRDPKQVIKWLEHKLKTGKSTKIDWLPYFKGFKGDISQTTTEDGKIKYIIKGKIQQDSVAQLTITELPIKYTLQSYIKVLDSLCEKDIIKSYRDLSDNDEFKFEVKVRREFFDNKTEDDILTQLKLIETVNDTLVLLDSNGKIKEYQDINEILEDYYNIRYSIYQKRLDHQLSVLNDDLKILNYKKMFIEGVINNKINIKDTINNVITQIEALKIEKINDSFDYLLDMKIYSLTADKVELLKHKIQEIQTNINELKSTTVEQVWLNELKDLSKHLS